MGDKIILAASPIPGNEKSVYKLINELMKKGAPKEEIAATCMAYVIAASDAMCKALIETFGDLPVVFSGGVSSNSMLRAHMSKKYGALFAEPRFSADNAAGIAVLASLSQEA